MKRKKAQVEKGPDGTVVAAKMRADGNKLTDMEREKLGEEFLKLYYGGDSNRSQLIAVDANVLFDLAENRDDIVDSVSVIRGRLRDARLLIPPTVQHELANWAVHGDTQKRDVARKAIRLTQSWRIIPASQMAVRHGIAERIADNIRARGLMPEEEVNDSLVLAESALLGCSMLLTSDEHLRGIDFERLVLELQRFDLAAPVIATPREIVRKFFPR